MKYNGDFLLTNTAAPIEFSTFSSDDPSASVTITDLAAGDVYIHKNGAAAPGTPGGKTVRIDVNGVTGNHLIVLDLTDTTDAGFYANGAFYTVRIEGATVDGATINAWVGSFSIGILANRTDQQSILADTNEMQADQADGGRLDLIWDATLADTNELQADWADGGRLDLKLDAAAALAGSGAATISITQKDSDSVAIPGCDVWVSTDSAGATVVAGTLVTDANGLVTFYLDAGTYYVWRQLAGYNFTNPQTLTVTVTAATSYTDGVAAAVGTGEAGLSIGLPELRKEVGLYLGLGGSGWSTAVQTRIDEIIQSGVRLVYYPPAVADDTVGYEWTWLKPTTTIDLNVPYATGTLTIASGVCTIASGTAPSWTDQAQLTISGGIYSVASRDSDTQFTLNDTSVTAAAGTSYSLTRVTYDLPNDFNRLVGLIHYAPDKYLKSIQLISVSRLLQLRAARTYSARPMYAATRYKTSTGQIGQRSEILFYPDNDEANTLTYQYEAYSGKLSSSYPYPLGGSHLAELYIESCLAVAERRVNNEVSFHNDQFTRLLIDAIKRDKGRDGHMFGQMGHREDHMIEFRRGYTGGPYPIIYDGGSI